MASSRARCGARSVWGEEATELNRPAVIHLRNLDQQRKDPRLRRGALRRALRVRSAAASGDCAEYGQQDHGAYKGDHGLHEDVGHRDADKTREPTTHKGADDSDDDIPEITPPPQHPQNRGKRGGDDPNKNCSFFPSFTFPRPRFRSDRNGKPKQKWGVGVFPTGGSAWEKIKITKTRRLSLSTARIGQP